ncbi:MAG: AAA family ATPase [Parvibaculaceae bacterium]
MQDKVEILLLTGPAGVGKSTLGWEIGAQLSAAGEAHAIIESDELDRVYPKPAIDDLNRLKAGTLDVSSINLAALWSTYRALGHWRLVMSGVMLHLEFDRRWILAAIPAARITVIRLSATEATLRARIAEREKGSGAEDQLRRTLRQAQRMAQEKADGLIVVPVDGQSPPELARLVLRQAGWLAD